MKNGMPQSLLSFEDMLEALPHPTELWEQSIFIDPTTGIEIFQLVNPHTIVVRPRYRSSIVATTPQGLMPLQFEIVASSLEEARLGWKPAAQAALRELARKMQEAQRRIIVPQAAANLPLKMN